MGCTAGRAEGIGDIRCRCDPINCEPRPGSTRRRGERYGGERVAAIGRCEQPILKGGKQFDVPPAWMHADISAPADAL